MPNLEERAAIWEIQRSRFGLPVQELPDHNGWVGSDIRNCCEAAYTLQLPIVEAAQYRRSRR
ncbi:MAG: hypothetical protein L0Y71_10040 [Gemmataceae bacterium]|nr:hypothetical protein [Gemmataceae bacterium]